MREISEHQMYVCVELDHQWPCFHFSVCFLKIPEIYWKYSTKRVLTMEYCDGGKVDDLPYMQNHKISSDEASLNKETTSYQVRFPDSASYVG